MKHRHARQSSKTARKQCIHAADPDHLVLKQLSFNVHLVDNVALLDFRRQIDVFFDIQKLSSDDLLDEALEHIHLGLKLAHFALNHIQSISAFESLSCHMAWVKIVNTKLSASLARTRILNHLPLFGILIAIEHVVVSSLVLIVFYQLIIPAHAIFEAIIAAIFITVVKFKIAILVDFLHGAATVCIDQWEAPVLSLTLVPQRLVVGHTLVKFIT